MLAVILKSIANFYNFTVRLSTSPKNGFVNDKKSIQQIDMKNEWIIITWPETILNKYVAYIGYAIICSSVKNT